ITNGYAQTIEQEGTKQAAVPPKQAIKYKLTFPQGTTYIEMYADYGTFSNSFNKNITYAPAANSTSYSFTVTWDRVSGSKGKITGYIKDANGARKDIKEYSQIVYYLDDYTPPTLSSTGKKRVLFGEQQVTFEPDKKAKFYYPNTTKEVSKCEWRVPGAWGLSSAQLKTNGAKLTATVDVLSGGTVEYRGINEYDSNDYSNYSSIQVERYGEFLTAPKEIDFVKEQNLTYTFTNTAGATYEWKYPSDWSVVSGTNTYSIILKRPKNSKSSNVQVRLKDNKTGKTSQWFSAPALELKMPDIVGDRVVKTGSQFSIPEVSSADITWSITGSDKITIDQSGVISVPAYTRTPSAEMTITATIAGVLIKKQVYYLADYLEGNSVINGNTNREFYCYAPTKIPQVGIPRGAKVDITITEPYVFIGSGITYRWQATEGGSRLRALNSQPTNRCHFEVMPQAEPGPLTIHTTITLDDFLAEYDIKYYVTGYSILMSSSNILTIEKEIPEDMPTDVILLNATDATQFEYQVIETSTGVVRMSGSAPTDQRLELDVSSLRDGIYTVIVSENGEVKAQQNISL
ncbi:MAG TPA: hypothetical protein H9778_01240, partial [Candidatus Parabacteroides intestinavium]|nr:hypothetical protein [Candidatus Parabacteroides intestinavium]